MISQEVTITSTITSGESELLSSETVYAATEGLLPYVIVLSGTAKTIDLTELSSVSAIFVKARFNVTAGSVVEGQSAKIGITLNLDPIGTEYFEMLGESYIRRLKTDGILSIQVDPLGETNTIEVRLFVVCE